MSIAEKLQVIAENEQRVYQAGYDKGLAEGDGGGYDEGYEVGRADGYIEGEAVATEVAEAHNAEILTDCNAVLPSKGVETADSLEQVPQRIAEIKVAEDMLRYCNKPNFPGLGVFDKEEVVLNFDYAYMINRMIYVDWGYSHYPNTKVKHLTLNFAQKIINAQQMFLDNVVADATLERVTLNADMSACTNFMQMFGYLTALRVVDGTAIDVSSATTINDLFGSVTQKVEEIRFVPNTIKVNIGFAYAPNLSDATIQSIVDGLAEVATAQTLTLHAGVGGKLTAEQKAIITAKNWTLVY